MNRRKLKDWQLLNRGYRGGGIIGTIGKVCRWCGTNIYGASKTWHTYPLIPTYSFQPYFFLR